MSAQTCSSPSVPFVPLPKMRQEAALPADRNSRAAERAPEQPASSRTGFFEWVWSAYRKRRDEARLRNLATELDEHMLQDVGAPEWLINEATADRERLRRRDVDYLRW